MAHIPVTLGEVQKRHKGFPCRQEEGLQVWVGGFALQVRRKDQSTGRLLPCSRLHWSSLSRHLRRPAPHTALCPCPTSPSMATVTTQVAATRSVHVKRSEGALAKGGGEEFASGSTAPWEFTSGHPTDRHQPRPGTLFPNGSGSPPFPWQQISPGNDTSLGFAHLVTLHCILLSIPKSSSPGVGLTRSFCQVTPF